MQKGKYNALKSAKRVKIAPKSIVLFKIICMYLYQFKYYLLGESVSIRFTKQANADNSRHPSATVLGGDYDWSQASCLHTKSGDIAFLAGPHEWVLIRGAHRWAAASVRSVLSVQVALVWRQQRAHLLPSLRVTAVSRTIQSRRCAGCGVQRSKLDSLSSPSYSLKTADFSSSIELDHFISAHMCRGLFLLSVLAYQSPLSYFHQRTGLQFSLKSQTHASLLLRPFEDLECRCEILNILLSSFPVSRGQAASPY